MNAHSSGPTLCLVNGPWQAISLCALFRQRDPSLSDVRALVVLVDMDEPSPLHDAAREVLAANGLTHVHTIAKSTPLRAFAAALADVERALGVGLADVQTLFTYGTHRPIARYVASGLPNARVIVYEEGLRAYVPPQGELRERLRFALAATWGRLDREFGRAWTSPSHEPTYGLLLGDALPLPDALRARPVQRVERAHLLAAVRAVNVDVPAVLPDTPYGVIVGQYYARLAQMSAERELAAYLRAARSLVERGLVPIWRGHIREHDAYFAELARACPELRNFADLAGPARLPLETYAEVFGAGCRAVVSFSSSALFYVPHLYGTPSYTLLDAALVARMNHPHRDACALALAHVPPLARVREAA